MSNIKKRKNIEAEREQELLECVSRAVANDPDDESLQSVRALVEVDRVIVNCIDENGRTPLILAAENGHVEIVRFLVEKRAKIEAVDSEGCTALGHAMIRNHVAVLQLLLESGAKVEQQFRAFGVTYSPLGFSMWRGTAEMVELLLRFRANTQEMLYRGETYHALHVACRHSSAEIVRLLLDHDDGVDVNAFVRCDGILMTPLCRACQRNSMEIAQLLVDHGAQVIFDGAGHDTPCPLKRAILCGSMELIEFLLGTLPEQVDNLPALSEPLETALRQFKLDVAQLLMDRGADVNGRPYLWMCTVWDQHPRLESCVRFLLDVGADVEMADYGETPLFAAARHGNVELVKMFLKAQANVNSRSIGDQTPLWIAAKDGHVGVVKELLRAQADVSMHDDQGETPLGAAYQEGHKGVVYLLLRTRPCVWPRLENVVV